MKSKVLAFLSVFIGVIIILPLSFVVPVQASGITTNGISFNGLIRLYTNFYNGVNGIVYDAQKAITTNPTIRAGYFATFEVTLGDAPVFTNQTDLAKSLLQIDNTSDKFHSLGAFSFTKINTHAPSKVTVTRVDTNTAPNAKATYKVRFENIQYTGFGNELSVPIYDNTGSITETRTVQVPGTYSKIETPPDVIPPSDDENAAKIAIETPYVIVNSYGYGKEIIKAGDTFPLTIMLKNTSDYTDVTNMLLTLKPSEGLKITNSSNTLHIPSLRAQDVVTKIINVTAVHTAAATSHTIDLGLDYQYLTNYERKSFQRTDTISIPVAHNDRFELTNIEAPKSSTMGEEISVTLNYVNKGKGDIYNLSAEIIGNFQNPGQKTNLGNLTAGSKGNVDFYINPSQAGNLAGEVRMTYEDGNGIERTQSLMFGVEVADAPSYEINPNPLGEIPSIPEPKKSNSVALWTGVGVVAVIVGIIITVKRIKKNRREWEDADL